MFSREKKAVFPFILFGLFDPEGLGAGAGLPKKRKRLEQPRQANVPKRKKAVFPFILFGLFDPEGLGAGAGFKNAP
ncbi:DNA helicase [Rossellomorea vietnamensis]|uniref:DNA helicase n=1 Tax=Rossellomorea vietnamensis TaxID=218284 RepID=UPI003CE7CAB5